MEYCIYLLMIIFTEERKEWKCIEIKNNYFTTLGTRTWTIAPGAVRLGEIIVVIVCLIIAFITVVVIVIIIATVSRQNLCINYTFGSSFVTWRSVFTCTVQSIINILSYAMSPDHYGRVVRSELLTTTVVDSTYRYIFDMIFSVKSTYSRSYTIPDFPTVLPPIITVVRNHENDEKITLTG